MNKQDIPSPCIRACTLDEHDICLGCRRSLEEIIEWSQAGPERKQAILQTVAQRKRQLQQKQPKSQKTGRN